MTNGQPGDTPLLLRRDGGVLWMTLNRPHSRQSIDRTLRDRLVEELIAADRDHSVRCIVITSSGRYFCTGADLSGGARTGAGSTGASKRPPLIDARHGIEYYQELFRVLWNLETPVVTAVNGTVAGIGNLLALLGDIVVAAEGTRFTSVFADGGMVAHAGDPYFLPRIFPFRRLMEFALLREKFTAEDLLSWNVINRVVPADQLESTAAAFAQRLAEGPTLILGQTKKLYRRSLDWDMATSFEADAMAIAVLSPAHDRKEGMQALIEGRKPEFTGE